MHKRVHSNLIECDRPANPANGHFECTSNKYKESSTCYLICNAGYIQAADLSTTCRAINASGTYEWDVSINKFSCVQACHLVAGGIYNGTKYSFLLLVPHRGVG